MAAASTNEKFDAAVKVIQSLPKNGTFQPSHELMLRFYGFYKQATLGPCMVQRPGFWDVVGKAKWDAWNSLGTMPKTEAMSNYVEELKKIIEMMPQTPNVAAFIEKLGTFYELVDVDTSNLPKMNGDVINNNSKKSRPHDNDDDDDETTMSINHVNSIVEKHLNQTNPGLPSSDLMCVALMEEEARCLENVVLTNHHNTENGSTDSNHLHINENGDDMINSSEDEQKDDTDDVTSGENGHHDQNEIVQLISLPIKSKTAPSPEPDTAVKSDSEDDEFCDTSEQLQMPLLISAKTQSEHTDPPTGHNQNLTITTAQIHSNTNGHSVNNRVTFSSADQTISTPQHQAAMSDTILHREAITQQRGGGDQKINNRAQSSSSRSSGSNHDTQSTSSSRQSPEHTAGLNEPIVAGGGLPPHQPGGQLRYDVNEQITTALAQLQLDMNHVLTRLNTLETYALLQRQVLTEEAERERLRNHNVPSWWPFNQISGKTVLFIVVWPFVVHYIIKLLSKRRRPLR
ncbi:acyl-CoA-binding domain-containing protein 5-like isoform X2 [Tubulanus polymorphus]|uniref:acyl-CoA-binding domain-containing protein 5-like isoform X2 n=1 Tax=Tubulanus polymorphus TaxID=672921 RepID=UPI003DA5EB4A